MRLLAKAQKHWGADAPDWILAMAEACDRTGQRKVAASIGYSQTTISQLLKQAYVGDIENIEEAVRGAFMGLTVSCPVLGGILTTVCHEWQKKAGRPLVVTSSHRTHMHRACRNCPRFQEGNRYVGR
ncbi:MAG: hypothetical protein R3E60_06950 [Alphaproteobacteria bacterium]